MNGNLILIWKKGEERHSLVRGKGHNFHHFVSTGRVGKKIETLSAKNGAKMLLEVLDDPSCETDPELTYELCRCLMKPVATSKEGPIDCGRQLHKCLPPEEEEERNYFNMVSHHELPH